MHNRDMDSVLFLFTVYLVTQGVNPREHGIKQELVCVYVASFTSSYLLFFFVTHPESSSLLQERIRTYMNKVKEITDKKKAARVDKGAAGRFVRNALYQPDEKDPKKKAAAKKAADTAADTPPSKLSKRS